MPRLEQSKTHSDRAKRRTEKICRRKISQRVSHTNSITPCGPQRRQNHSRRDSGRAYSRSGQGCDPSARYSNNPVRMPK